MSNVDDFLETFDEIKGTGRFCSVGSAPFFFPHIRIAGGEELAFPLDSAQVDRIIAAAERAPYGRGEATVFDETVRKSWQVDAADLVIESADWAKLLNKWLKQIAIDLSIEGEIDAQLYKLLLYGEGGHFKAHRDTEKLDAMFGTLVIALPSKHSGGTLWVRHAGEEQSIDFSAPAHAYDFQYVALFADCEHEVAPVTAGHRCCLVYNLVLKKGDPTLLNNLVAEQAALLKPHLESKEFCEVDQPQVVLLQHQYTEANFSLEGLKNNDRSKAQALLMAAEDSGHVAYLALVTLHQEGELEGIDYYGRSRGRGYWDDYDIDYDDGEMGEIYSESLSIGNWLDAHGQVVELGDFAIQADQLITRDTIDDDDPIEKSGEGPTGNAGCTMDYWYRRGAVVFWPKARHSQVIAKSNPMAACKQFLEQAKVPELKVRENFSELGTALIEVFANQPEPVSNYEDAPVQAILIRAIGEAGAPTLFQSAIERWGVCHFRSCSAEDWRLLFERFEAKAFLPLLDGFTDDFLFCQRSVVFNLLQGLLSGPSEALVEVGSRFIERAVCFKPMTLIDKPYYSRNQSSAADEIHCLLAGSFLVSDEAIRHSIREFVLVDRSLEAVRQTLVPALLQTTGNRYYRKPNSLCPEIANWVRTQLADEVSRAILPYPDWARPSTVKIDKLYPKFSTFLKDPVQKVYVYPAKQSIREQMKQIIKSESVDVDCETVKKGSPHQLVCTKNSASYKRARHVRAQDERDLNALNELFAQ